MGAGKYLIFTSVAFEIVGLIWFADFLGKKLDETYHSQGLIFSGLSFLFLLLWAIQIIWMVKKMDDNPEDQEPPPQT